MGIIDTLKTTASVLREADKIDLYQQILGVMEKLIDMQKRLGELVEENKKLKELIKIKDDMKYEHNAYWLEQNGLFCTRCRDKNKDLIRMVYERPYFKCPECKNSFEGPDMDSYKQEIRSQRMRPSIK